MVEPWHKPTLPFSVREHTQLSTQSFNIEFRMSRDYCKVPANLRAEPCHRNRRQSFNLILLCPLFPIFLAIRPLDLMLMRAERKFLKRTATEGELQMKIDISILIWGSLLYAEAKARGHSISLRSWKSSDCMNELQMCYAIIYFYVAFNCWNKFCLHIQHLNSRMRSNYCSNCACYLPSAAFNPVNFKSSDHVEDLRLYNNLQH